MLAKEGIEIKGPFIDVMLIAQMLVPDEGVDGKKKGLKQLVRKYLKDPFVEEIRLKQWLKANKKTVFADAPKHIIEPYATADAKRTLELLYYFMGGLDTYNMWAVLEREMLLMRDVVMPMEDEGVSVNTDEIEKLTVVINKDLAGMKARMCSIAGDAKFNPNSQKQVLVALAKEGIFKPTRFSRKTGKPKADATALLEFPSELGSLLSQYRKLGKAKSTYLKNLKKKHLYVSFNQGGARTGRFSSSGPNLQNIPRPNESMLGQMRKLFVAEPGTRLLSIDYSQIELRLTAHFSKEQHMLDAIIAGQDLHGLTCKKMFGIDEQDPSWDMRRYLAKKLNFAVLYGIGPDKFRNSVLLDTSGKMRISLVEATTAITSWKIKHPKVMKLFDDYSMEVVKTGGIENYYGRFISVDQSRTYVSVNYKIQGTAADFLKKKKFEVVDFLKPYKTKLIMTVHDELIFRLHQDERHIVKKLITLMEDTTTFDVPLLCSAKWGANWFDQKKIEV